MAALRVLAASTLASMCAGLVADARKKDDVLVTHNLTICNGYADRKPLSVYTMTNKAKLTENPLDYKVCKMISLELGEGERLDFKLGGLSVGTFRATGLPYTPANLLLVPYHKDTKTMSASFASHAFSAMEGSQVAVIDAYVGNVNNTMQIQTKSRSNRQSGELKPGASISIPPNVYSVFLSNERGRHLKELKLDAVPSTRYVVMRVGSEADGHEEDLVVSPATGNEKEEGSGSLRSGLGVFALAAAVASLAAA